MCFFRPAVLPYIVNPVALQQIVLGQNATIRCQYNADASPTPTTYWYKGNRQINDSRLTVISGGLLIASVASTDEGNYTCVVLSGVGSASIIITAVFRGNCCIVVLLSFSLSLSRVCAGAMCVRVTRVYV